MCNTPEDLDLKGIDTVAVDIETYDPNLKTKGLGAIRNDGFITGVAVATGKETVYFCTSDIGFIRFSLLVMIFSELPYIVQFISLYSLYTGVIVLSLGHFLHSILLHS